MIGTTAGFTLPMAYTPWGRGTWTTSSFTRDSPLKWQGQHGVLTDTDFFIGQSEVHMGARNYQFDQMRFRQVDPLPVQEGTSDTAYSYASQDPVNHIDPDGRFVVKISCTTTPGIPTGAGNFTDSGYDRVTLKTSTSCSGHVQYLKSLTLTVAMRYISAELMPNRPPQTYNGSILDPVGPAGSNVIKRTTPSFSYTFEWHRMGHSTIIEFDDSCRYWYKPNVKLVVKSYRRVVKIDGKWVPIGNKTTTTTSKLQWTGLDGC